MGFEGKPDTIKAGIKAEDSEFLSAAGRKGAETVNAKKKRAREREEIAELHAEIKTEKQAMEAQAMREAANEHIITPDGDDLDYSR